MIILLTWQASLLALLPSLTLPLCVAAQIRKHVHTYVYVYVYVYVFVYVYVYVFVYVYVYVYVCVYVYLYTLCLKSLLPLLFLYEESYEANKHDESPRPAGDSRCLASSKLLRDCGVLIWAPPEVTIPFSEKFLKNRESNAPFCQ